MFYYLYLSSRFCWRLATFSNSAGFNIDIREIDNFDTDLGRIGLNEADAFGFASPESAETCIKIEEGTNPTLSSLATFHHFCDVIFHYKQNGIT